MPCSFPQPRYIHPAMLASLSLLTVLAGAALVAAQDLVTPVDWATDVTFPDPADWNSTDVGQCGIIDHYTSVPGAEMTVVFTGAFCTVSTG